VIDRMADIGIDILIRGPVCEKRLLLQVLGRVDDRQAQSSEIQLCGFFNQS
jgi:hypothetical protein